MCFPFPQQQQQKNEMNAGFVLVQNQNKHRRKQDLTGMQMPDTGDCPLTKSPLHLLEFILDTQAPSALKAKNGSHTLPEPRFSKGSDHPGT